MTNENRDARMMILIPSELKEQTKVVANQQGTSMNEIINKALAAYIKRYMK